MKKVRRQHKAYSLEPETIKAIKAKAIEGNENDSRALDTIVAEWLEFTTDKQPPEESNQEVIDSILERLNRLEAVLADTTLYAHKVTSFFDPKDSEPDSE